MPIDYNDFLNFSIDLNKSASKEIDYRNVISRAYYAAFHAIDNFIMINNFEMPEKVGEHHKRQLALLNCKTASIRNKMIKIAKNLKTFHELRCEADYGLNFSINKISANQAITRAKDIILSIDKVSEILNSPNKTF